MYGQSCPTLWLHGLKPTRLFCPWNFPGKITGVDCHFLLQRIFPTEGSNPCLLHLLHWQRDSLPAKPLGKSIIIPDYLWIHTKWIISCFTQISSPWEDTSQHSWGFPRTIHRAAVIHFCLILNYLSSEWTFINHSYGISYMGIVWI